MAYSEKNRQEAIKLFKKGLERIEKNSKDGWENELYRQFRESLVGLEMQNTWKYKSDAVYDSKFYKHTKTKKEDMCLFLLDLKRVFLRKI